MTIRTLPLLVAAAILAPGARTAGAQAQHPIDAVRENARSHVGPFYITPGLMLRELGIDSNVFNQPENPRSDFTFTLVPKADIAVPIARRALLKLATAVDLVYYQKYSSERSTDPRMAPRAEVYLNKVTVFGEGAYVSSRQRPSYEIDARSHRMERFVGGGIDYAYSPRLTLEVGARWSDVEYDAGALFMDVPLSETLNRRSRDWSASARYAVTSKTTLVLKTGATQDHFEYSPIRDADSFRVMPGVEFNSRALVFGTGYIGFRNYDARSDAIEDFRGLVGSASLGCTVLGRTVILFEADRDVMYSFERFQPYYLVDSYGLTVRHRLPGKFDVMVGAGRHQYAYRDLVVPGAPVPALAGQRVDVTRNLSGSVGYILGPDVRIGFGASYWRRESNWTQYRDYDKVRIGLSLTYGF